MPLTLRQAVEIHLHSMIFGTFSREKRNGVAIFSRRLMERVRGLGLRTVFFLPCERGKSTVRAASDRGADT
jgi:hypothetical protein